MEGFCLLACSSGFAQPAFSYKAEGPPAQGDTVHSGLGPSLAISSKNNTPTGLSTGQSHGDIFPIKTVR